MTVICRSNAPSLAPRSADVRLTLSVPISGVLLGAAAFLGILITKNLIGGVVSPLDIDESIPTTTSLAMLDMFTYAW